MRAMRAHQAASRMVELEFPACAGVAQLVEQLIRNQQVIGSSPIAGSRITSKPNEFQDHGIV
jgi:hypothetical protein